jgi:hypothetical protein
MQKFSSIICMVTAPRTKQTGFKSCTYSTIYKCCGTGSVQIRTFLVGSGRLGQDADSDPDPGLDK